MQRIGRCRTHHNCRAMLIVVEHRNLHPLAAQLFNDETIRCLDVLKVDTAQRRLQRGNDVHELVGIRLSEFDIENIDISKYFKQ